MQSAAPAAAPPRYVVGVDGGTEGMRAGVFDTADGVEVAYASEPYATSFPHPSWCACAVQQRILSHTRTELPRR